MKLKWKWYRNNDYIKMKFLLSYNMKIVVLWGDKNLVRAFFLVKEDYPRHFSEVDFCN